MAEHGYCTDVLSYQVKALYMDLLNKSAKQRSVNHD